MAIRNYVPVDVDDLPATYLYDLDGTTYQFTFDYNEEGDFFTVDLADESGNVLVTGEKLVLNQPLFASLPYNDAFPSTPLVPMDESNQATYCGIDNFMQTVFLYEDTVDPDNTELDMLPIDGDWDGDVDG